MLNKSFNFATVYTQKQPKLRCKFITSNNDFISIEGDSIKQIFYKCITLFPNGIKTKGLMFSGINQAEAKKHFCELICLGLETGYFYEKDFGNFDIDPDDMELQ